MRCCLGLLQKSNSKYGNEHEAIAVYHMMRGVEKFCPIYTLCIGNAFGEAALLLAAGSKVRGSGSPCHRRLPASLLHILVPGVWHKLPSHRAYHTSFQQCPLS